MSESAFDCNVAHHTSQCSLEARLNQFPQLRARVEELLKIVEDSAGEMQFADDAEQRVISQMRLLGQEVLSVWASGQAQKSAAQFGGLNAGVQKDGKKTLLVYHAGQNRNL